MKKKYTHWKKWVLFGILVAVLGVNGEADLWSKPDQANTQNNDWVPVVGKCASCKPSTDLDAQATNEQIRNVLSAPSPNTLNLGPPQGPPHQFQKQPRLINNNGPPNYPQYLQPFGKQDNKQPYYPPTPQKLYPSQDINSVVHFQQPVFHFDTNPFPYQKVPPNDGNKYFVGPYKPAPFNLPQQIFFPLQVGGFSFGQQPKYQQAPPPQKPDLFSTTTVAPKSTTQPKIRFPENIGSNIIPNKQTESNNGPEIQLLYVPVEALQRGRTVKTMNTNLVQNQPPQPNIPQYTTKGQQYQHPQYTTKGQQYQQYTTQYPFQFHSTGTQFTFPQYTTPQYPQFQDKRPNSSQYPGGSQYPTGLQYQNYQQQPLQTYFSAHDNASPHKTLSNPSKEIEPPTPYFETYPQGPLAPPVPSKLMEPPTYNEYVSQDFNVRDNKGIPQQDLNNYALHANENSQPSSTENYNQYTKSQNLLQTSPQQFSTVAPSFSYLTTKLESQPNDPRLKMGKENNYKDVYTKSGKDITKDYSDIKYVTNGLQQITPTYFPHNQQFQNTPSFSYENQPSTQQKTSPIPLQNAQQLYTFSTSIQTLAPSTGTTYSPQYTYSPELTTAYPYPSNYPMPHQPPLSVYMEKYHNSKINDILNLLKTSKTIPVLDTVEGDAPQVFVGPTELQPPRGYVKFDLPYLSSLDSNRIERMIDHLPFFVAPLNFKPPAGYSKIPFPAPHIGSVVISNATIYGEMLHDKNPSTIYPTIKYPTIKVSSAYNYPTSEIPNFSTYGLPASSEATTSQQFASEYNPFLYTPSKPAQFAFVTSKINEVAEKTTHRNQYRSTTSTTMEYPKRNTQRQRRPLQRGYSTTTAQTFVDVNGIQSEEQYVTEVQYEKVKSNQNQYYTDNQNFGTLSELIQPRYPNDGNVTTDDQYYKQEDQSLQYQSSKDIPSHLNYYQPKEQNPIVTTTAQPISNAYSQNFNYQNSNANVSEINPTAAIFSDNYNNYYSNKENKINNYDDNNNNNSNTYVFDSNRYDSNVNNVPKQSTEIPITSNSFEEFSKKNVYYNPLVENQNKIIPSSDVYYNTESPIFPENASTTQKIQNYSEPEHYFPDTVNFQSVKSLSQFKPSILREDGSFKTLPDSRYPSSEPNQYLAYQPWSHNQLSNKPDTAQYFNPTAPGNNEYSQQTILTNNPEFESKQNYYPDHLVKNPISSTSSTEISTDGLIIPQTTAPEYIENGFNSVGDTQFQRPTESTSQSQSTEPVTQTQSSAEPVTQTSFGRTRGKHRNRYNSYKYSTTTILPSASDSYDNIDDQTHRSEHEVFNKILTTKHNKYNNGYLSEADNHRENADVVKASDTSTKPTEMRTLVTRRRRPLRPTTTTPSTSVSTEYSTTVSRSIRTRFSRPPTASSTENIKPRARRPTISTTTSTAVTPNLEWESSYINNNFSPSASGSNEIIPIDNKSYERTEARHHKTQGSDEQIYIQKSYNLTPFNSNNDNLMDDVISSVNTTGGKLPKQNIYSSDVTSLGDASSGPDIRDNDHSSEKGIPHFKHENEEESSTDVNEVKDVIFNKKFGDKDSIVDDDKKIADDEIENKETLLQKEEQDNQKKYDPQNEKKAVHGRRRGTWVRRIRVKRPQDVLETAESQNLGRINAIKTSDSKSTISKSEDTMKDKIKHINSGEVTETSPNGFDGIHKDFTDMLTELLSSKDNSENNPHSQTVTESEADSYNNYINNANTYDNSSTNTGDKNIEDISSDVEKNIDDTSSSIDINNDDTFSNIHKNTEDTSSNNDKNVNDANIDKDINDDTAYNINIFLDSSTHSVNDVSNSEENITTVNPGILEITKSTEESYETLPSKVIGTSTTTEISLETEICYKGRCVKSKKAKAIDLLPTE